MKTPTKIVKGREVLVGQYIGLDDGAFQKVQELVRAPMRIEFSDGTRVTPRWAYLAGGGHATICADDDVIVRA